MDEITETQFDIVLLQSKTNYTISLAIEALLGTVDELDALDCHGNAKTMEMKKRLTSTVLESLDVFALQLHKY